jgi:hypothetical protein
LVYPLVNIEKTNWERSTHAFFMGFYPQNFDWAMASMSLFKYAITRPGKLPNRFDFRIMWQAVKQKTTGDRGIDGW